MFLNPWYAGQPSAGGQPSGVGGPPENGHAPSSPSPEEVHPTYSSDPGQDLIVEQSDLSDEQMKHLATVQQALRPGWTVHLTTEGRFYYCNHYNQTRLVLLQRIVSLSWDNLEKAIEANFFIRLSPEFLPVLGPLTQ